MTQNTKRIALLCLLAALGSVLLLSSSLSNLELQAGMPFPGGGNSIQGSQPGSDVEPEPIFSSTLLKGIFDLILLILVISVPLRLISLVNMKRLLLVLLVVAALLLLAFLMSRLPGGEAVHLPSESSGVATQPSSEYPVSPLGEPPQGLIWFVLTGVVLGVGFLVITLVRQRQVSTSIEEKLSQEAESALHAIRVGEDVRSVIIRSYLKMNQALQEEQEIERSENMTVREFEDWLKKKGFPSDPIRQLSRLFEGARYSQQELSKEDEGKAVESLNEILQVCRSPRKSLP